VYGFLRAREMKAIDETRLPTGLVESAALRFPSVNGCG